MSSGASKARIEHLSGKKIEIRQFSLQQSTGYLSGRSLVLSVETLKKRPAAGERAGACGK